MYLLTAIFNNSCLRDVLIDLREREIEGVTISQVLGKGGLGFIKDSGETELDHKVRLDIVSPPHSPPVSPSSSFLKI